MEPEHEIQKYSVLVINIKVDQNLNQFCPVRFRDLKAVSLYLHPKPNSFPKRKAAQLLCSLTMRQEMLALAACTQFVMPPCQIYYFN